MGSSEIITSDISVVVQGAIDRNNTPRCLESIRKFLPGAEIVLSTWENAVTEGLTYDKVLLNKDPGGHKDRRTNFVNNLNRQLVSSLAGIQESRGKYVLKLRSDIILESDRFLRYINLFPKRDPEFTLFEHRVIFCSYFFKRYLGERGNTIHPLPFHISDWLAFGIKQDVLKLFNVPLAQEPQNTNYLLENRVDALKIDMFGASHQYAPEQYIFYQCAVNNIDCVPRFNNIMDYNAENIEFSDRLVANNCIILDPRQFRIYCGKNGMDPYREWTTKPLSLPYYVWEGLFTHYEFWKAYIRYCDNTVKIPSQVIRMNHLYKNFHRFFTIERITQGDEIQ